mmetsp:Transcript_61445/g.126889  ORF Transcript_61445/g.126889 Transcript_61445/m.126889 type:complete len:150 (+) Transcript_61445:210-659(+)
MLRLAHHNLKVVDRDTVASSQRIRSMLTPVFLRKSSSTVSGVDVCLVGVAQRKSTLSITIINTQEIVVSEAGDVLRVRGESHLTAERFGGCSSMMCCMGRISRGRIAKGHIAKGRISGCWMSGALLLLHPLRLPLPGMQGPWGRDPGTL